MKMIFIPKRYGLPLIALILGFLIDTNSVNSENVVTGSQVLDPKNPGQCELTLEEKKNVSALCSSVMEQVIAGWTLDSNEIPVDPDFAELAKTDKHGAMSRSLVKYTTTNSKAMCLYVKSKITKETGCCPGYHGDKCDLVSCFTERGGCKNGGVCEGIDFCKCPAGLGGPQCEEDSAAMAANPNQKYCYAGETCYRLMNKPGDKLMTYEDCCNKKKGLSWGNHQGTCVPCNEMQSISKIADLSFDTCVSYGPDAYRTFDGRVYQFSGRCRYNFASQTNGKFGSWRVYLHLINCDHCKTCRKGIDMQFGSRNIFVKGFNVSYDDKNVIFSLTTAPLSISGADVKISRNGDHMFMEAESGNVRMKWDDKNYVAITVERTYHSQNLIGLCGNADGNPVNDFGSSNDVISFGNFHKDDACPNVFKEPNPCNSAELIDKATKLCTLLKSSFFHCRKVIDVQPAFDYCLTDMCKYMAKNIDGDQLQELACQHYSAFNERCTDFGKCNHFRSKKICPKKCENPEMTWLDCAPLCPRTCANFRQPLSKRCQVTKTAACICPDNTVFHNGKCISPKECPCIYSGQAYNNRDTFKIGCNTCTCVSGIIKCTKFACLSQCKIMGSQMKTFDGNTFSINGGSCKYSIVEPTEDSKEKRDQISVTMEPLADVMKPTSTSAFNTLPRKISATFSDFGTVEFYGHPTHEGVRVMVNGVDRTKLLPYEDMSRGIYIRRVTSHYWMVKFSHHIKIVFDGHRSAYIHLSHALKNKVVGLCGRFDGDTQNDIYEKKSALKSSIVELVRSYQIGNCEYEAKIFTPDPITAETSKKKCDQIFLHAQLFKACRDSNKVDLLYYNQICQTELSMQGNTITASSYPGECNAVRNAIMECGRHDSGILPDLNDELIQQCSPKCLVESNSVAVGCAKTCNVQCNEAGSSSISCETEMCLSGCECNKGADLRSNSGRCAPPEACPCFDLFNKKSPEYKYGETIQRSCKECVCKGGKFVCTKDICTEDIICPKNQIPRTEIPSCHKCSDHNKCSKKEMIPARCGCPDDMVMRLDGTCVKKNDCPCVRHGNEYNNGHVIRSDCDRYMCNNTIWANIGKDETTCEGVCSAFGDPHYITFDKKYYTFQGACAYSLVKSAGFESRGIPAFEIQVGNVKCGSRKVTCTKHIKLVVDGEEFTLFRGKKADSIPVNSKYEMKLDHLSIFTQLSSHKLGIRILWDRGMRLYVYLKTAYKGKVTGLCGNFNGNSQDDFMKDTVIYDEPDTFGDAWAT